MRFVTITALIAAFGLTACAYLPPKTMARGDKHPEKAPSRGYFVSGDEAAARGGLGNYVDRAPLVETAQVKPATAPVAVNPAPTPMTAPDAIPVSAANAEPPKKVWNKVLFAVSSAKLTTKAAQEIDAISTELKATRGTIELQGFADSTGTPKRNLVLSRARAAAVKAELLKQGVPAQRIAVRDPDLSKLPAHETSAEARALNRQVAIQTVIPQSN